MQETEQTLQIPEEIPDATAQDAELAALENVSIAQDVLAELVAKRADAVARRPDIEARQRALGYALHVRQDAGAKRELMALTRAAHDLAGEIASLEGAIEEAKRHEAEAAARLEELRGKSAASELRAIAAQMRVAGEAADSAARTLLAALLGIETLSTAMQEHGSSRPTRAIVQNGLRRALLAAFCSTPYQSSPLPPNERRTFAQLTAAWSTGAEDIAARVLDGSRD
jgi:DNA repair exonuclease SbcCD ATPase subunit